MFRSVSVKAGDEFEVDLPQRHAKEEMPQEEAGAGWDGPTVDQPAENAGWDEPESKQPWEEPDTKQAWDEPEPKQDWNDDKGQDAWGGSDSKTAY